MVLVALILSALANLVPLVYALIRLWRFAVVRVHRWRRRNEGPIYWIL